MPYKTARRITAFKNSRPAAVAKASPRPAKKAKLDDSFSAGDPIVEIILESGETTHPFNIHKRLLCTHSSYFREHLEPLDEPKPLVLRDVSLQVFETFSRWIYTKALVVEELEDDDSGPVVISDNSDSDSGSEGSNDNGNNGDGESADISVQATGGAQHSTSGEKSPSAAGSDESGESDESSPSTKLKRKGRVFLRLLKLYKFATTFQAKQFENAIMIQWQRFTIDNETLPCQTIVTEALSGLSLESHLCQYLIACYGHYTDYGKMNKDRFAKLSSEFLTRVLEIAFARIDGGDVASMDENWCAFHEHEDYIELEECEQSREDDPDVKAKRTANKSRLSRRWGGCC